LKPREELGLSVHDEARLFKVGLQGNEDDKMFARKRVSYVVKAGKIVKNKRVYKTCPICNKDQKQIPKHVNTVHANMSKDIR